jgi:hypothetical protein
MHQNAGLVDGEMKLMLGNEETRMTKKFRKWLRKRWAEDWKFFDEHPGRKFHMTLDKNYLFWLSHRFNTSDGIECIGKLPMDIPNELLGDDETRAFMDGMRKGPFFDECDDWAEAWELIDGPALVQATEKLPKGMTTEEICDLIGFDYDGLDGKPTDREELGKRLGVSARESETLARVNRRRKA